MAPPETEKQNVKSLKEWLTKDGADPRFFAITEGKDPMFVISKTKISNRPDAKTYGTVTHADKAFSLTLTKGKCPTEMLRALTKAYKARQLRVAFVMAGEDGAEADDDMQDALSVAEEDAADLRAFQNKLDKEAAEALQEKRQQAPELPPEPKGPIRVIWKDDLTARVRALHNNPAIEMGPTPVELAVPQDVIDALRGLGAEAHLQKMVDLSQQLAGIAAQKVAKAHQNAGKRDEYKAKLSSVPADFDERFLKQVVGGPTDAAIDALRDDLAQLPGRVLQAAKLPNIPPGWFKTKAVVSVAAPAVGFVAGAAAAVVGSVLAQPEVAVPAAYATARSAASGYQAVNGLWKDTLATKKSLEKTIEGLEVRYREAMAARQDGNLEEGDTRTSTNLEEMGLAALNAAAGKDVADTIPKVRGLLDDLEGKLARARKTYDAATQEVHNILKFVDKGVLELKGDVAKQLDTSLKVAEKTAPKISGVAGHIGPLRNAVEALEAELSKGAHNAAIILPLVVDLGLVVTNLGASGAGLAKSFETSVVFSSRAAECVNASVNSAVDIGGAASSAKGAYDSKR